MYPPGTLASASRPPGTILREPSFGNRVAIIPNQYLFVGRRTSREAKAPHCVLWAGAARGYEPNASQWSLGGPSTAVLIPKAKG